MTVTPSETDRSAALSDLEEKYPRIVEALCAVWGRETCLPYLRSLLFDERGGRQGFPGEVGTELMLIYRLLDFRPEGDMWTEADQRL